MFEALYGYVVSASPDSLVLGPGSDEESFGFAYRVIVAKSSKYAVGSHQALLVFHHKSEYADTLYGFDDCTEREFFRDLISADKIGPKAAMNIMALGGVEDIKQAIRMGNADFLRRAKGVNKGAENIILKLGKRYANSHFEKSHPGLL